MTLILRHERPEDLDDISTVTKKAFYGMSYSSGTEHLIVDELRKTYNLTISMVAIADFDIVGHIAISPIYIIPDARGWYGLGPISVLPSYQRQGIGTKLVNSTLKILREQRANGCVLVGDPHFYGKFGFKATHNLVYPNVPPEYFQILPFSGNIPLGSIRFDNAFDIKK